MEAQHIRNATTVWPGPVPEPEGLNAMFGAFAIGREAQDSWNDLKRVVLGLIGALNAKDVLEIGGGRFPYLSLDEVEPLGCELTVNDILDSELARAPAGYRRSCFDISGPLPETIAPESYDFIFSRMVFEHVRDGRQAWANCLKLLRPGGVAFAFVPTLWSPPFLVNRVFPERLSNRLLQLIDPDRTQEKVPKFPAYYDLCRGEEKSLAPVLTELGFSDVIVHPFFGTPYFPVIPVVKHVARAFDRMVQSRDWRAFSSYAYIAGRK